VIPADEFFDDNAGPPRQGDILLAGVARLVAEDRYTPQAWVSLDAADVAVDLPNREDPFRLATGPALVMVTSHDCHFDKEWNRLRSSLIKSGLDEDAATRRADEDETLDRTFTASPLVVPDDLLVHQGNLMAGRVVGYLPVPASPDGLVPEAVVDLTYRATLDRLDIVRVACISRRARAQLRYALARLDSFRATTVGFELEAVVGRHIERVSFPRQQPLFVRLQLDDGQHVDLLQQPAEPADGPARSAPSGPAASGFT